MPIYMFCLIYIIYVQYQIGSGPFWHLMQKMTSVCSHDNNWVKNLLFFNNIGYDPGLKELETLILESP